MKRGLFVALLVTIVYMAAAQPAWADLPVEKRELVWVVVSSLGERYEAVFSPAEVPTLYLLAGQRSVLVPKYTYVYYWPVDRELKPDWDAENTPISGTLEVLDKGGNSLERIGPDHFIATNEDRSLAPWTVLLLGPEADAAYEEYEQERDDYFRHGAEYDRTLEEFLRAQASNPDSNDLRAPTPVPPFLKALVPPKEGFPLQLGAGEFQIRLLDETGMVIPGSQRKVVSIEARRQSVGYRVIPQSRWTVPETSNAIDEVMYFSPEGATVFLQAVQINEFNQQEYVRITRPQDRTVSPNRWIWLAGEPLKEVTLQVWAEGDLVARVSELPYSVRQTDGSSLGYEVVPFDEGMQPRSDFEAFEVFGSPQTPAYTLRLVRQDGRVVPGSERMLVRASPTVPLADYGVALFPLAIGLVMKWRHWAVRARSARAIASDPA